MHKNECQCSVCTYARESGLTMDQAIARRKSIDDQMMAKYGFVVHLIVDSDKETKFEAHTHGLEDSISHPDLEIVCPLPQDGVAWLFHRAVESIKENGPLVPGEVRMGIAANDLPILPIEAVEGGRTVIRMIMPDRNGELDETLMEAPFELQYEDRG